MPGDAPGRLEHGHRLRPIERSDVRALSACLARAFDDDPVSEYLFPNRRSHARRLERYFRWQFHHVFFPKGDCWTTEDLAGAALWIPPRRRSPSIVETVTQLATVVRILGMQTSRALRLLEQLEAVHPKMPHCYLGTIGVDPSRQGTGVGSALMSVVLDALDEEGVPAYLESSKESNLAFYRRHGFEVTGEIGTGRDSGIPRIWLMWRSARSAAPHSVAPGPAAPG
jgi:ribosomal protein S18 acetylase RimI-like enzyme